MSKFEEFDADDPLAPKPNRHAKRVLDLTQAVVPDKTIAQGVIDMLLDQGYAKKSIATYYNAWKNYWASLGTNVTGWPKAPKLERKIVPVLTHDEVEACIDWMDKHSDYRYRVKAAAIRLCLFTGMRIEKEVLTEGSWFWLSHSDDYSLLQVTGKGEHQRQVVVVDDATRKIDQVPPVSYMSVRRAWKKAVMATAKDNPYVANGQVPTLHSIRHVYAKATYEKSGDILTTRNQLGHASVETTQDYLRHTSLDRTVKQLAGG